MEINISEQKTLYYSTIFCYWWIVTIHIILVVMQMRSSRQFSFLNGPRKLVFVRTYGSTITGLVEQPYPYCLLVAFCTFLCFFVPFCNFLCFWCVQNLFAKTPFTIWGYHDNFKPVYFAFDFFFFFTKRYCTHKNTHKQKLTNKTKIN